MRRKGHGILRAAICSLGISLLVATLLFTPNPAEAVVERKYTLPFFDSFRIACGFGCYSGHKGVDYELGVYGVGGERVAAAAAGTAKPCPYDPGGGGSYIVLDHGNGHRTRYLHLNAPALPADGASVGRGDVIGYEGATGYTVPPGFNHLHFETRHGATQFTCGITSADGTAVDPYGSSTYMWRSSPPLRAFDVWNMLKNASLESGSAPTYTPWTPMGAGTTLSVPSGGAKSGSRYLRAYTSVSGGSVYQDMTVPSVFGESYVFSVWARAASVSPSVSVVLWGLGGTNESTGTAVALSTSWKLISAPLDVVQSGHTSLRAQMYLPVGVNVDFDNMEVIQVANKKASFEDPNFVQNPLPWQKSNPPGGVTQWARYSGGAKSGGAYMQTNKTASGTASVYQDIAIVPSPGESYIFSVWMRSPSAALIQGSVAIWALGGTQESTSQSFTLATTPWTQVFAQLDVANTGHTSLRIQIYLDTANQNYDVDGTLAYKNLLGKASFEQADSLGSPYWQKANPSGGVTQWARYNTGGPKSGTWLLQANSNPAGGSVYQDIAIAPAVDESHTFVIWLRCNSGCTASSPLNGSVVLWGLTPNDGTGTSFSFTSVGTWEPVYASLDVDTAGHTSMRAQVYINTAQRNLDLDAGGNSVSFCHSATC